MNTQIEITYKGNGSIDSVVIHAPYDNYKATNVFDSLNTRMTIVASYLMLARATGAYTHCVDDTLDHIRAMIICL